MAYDEKRAWIMAVVSAGTYGVYVAIILGRAQHTPITEVPYIATLLFTIGASIVATIILSIIIATVSPRDAGKKDLRDREINRFGEYTGQSLVLIGAVAALGMAMARWDYFWIANVIYLGFVLSAIVGSIAKIASYRFGFRPW